MSGLAQLVDRVTDEVDGLSKKQVFDIVKAILEYIETALEAGDQVSIAGFGRFAVVFRQERVGRNPATGKQIVIPASRTVGFRPGRALKDAVNSRGPIVSQRHGGRSDQSGDASSSPDPPRHIKLAVDPGDAPPEVVAEVLSEISRLYRRTGGSGVVFSFSDVFDQKKVLS